MEVRSGSSTVQTPSWESNNGDWGPPSATSDFLLLTLTNWCLASELKLTTDRLKRRKARRDIRCPQAPEE